MSRYGRGNETFAQVDGEPACEDSFDTRFSPPDLSTMELSHDAPGQDLQDL